MLYAVWAYGVMIARFNDFNDAKEWAEAQSKKFPRGWKEVRNKGVIETAYENGAVVYGA